MLRRDTLNALEFCPIWTSIVFTWPGKAGAFRNMRSIMCVIIWSLSGIVRANLRSSLPTFPLGLKLIKRPAHSPGSGVTVTPYRPCSSNHHNKSRPFPLMREGIENIHILCSTFTGPCRRYTMHMKPAFWGNTKDGHRRTRGKLFRFMLLLIDHH